jgi:hypothetical protein
VAQALLPAASALLPTLGSDSAFTAGESVETSLDTAGASAAGKSARATAEKCCETSGLAAEFSGGMDISFRIEVLRKTA